MQVWGVVLAHLRSEKASQLIGFLMRSNGRENNHLKKLKIAVKEFFFSFTEFFRPISGTPPVKNKNPPFTAPERYNHPKERGQLKHRDPGGLGV